MESLKIKEIVSACRGKLLQGNPEFCVRSFSTDTRTFKKGDFYIPLKGEKFDGHDFIEKAVQEGAAGLIASRKVIVRSDISIIKVKDTLRALMDIASFYRKKNKVKCVAITGSCGKTITKELVYEVLRKKFKTLKSEANFNNEIGTSKTIFNLNNSYEFAVIEMAMRGPGQIKELARIILPQIGIITNIGHSHYEFMKSLKVTAKTKGELLKELPRDGVAILNSDDRFFRYLSKFYRGTVLSFGIENEADVRAKDIENLGLDGFEFTVDIKGRPYRFRLPLLGRHNVYNCLVAIACGLILKVPINLIQSALRDCSYGNMRMQKLYLKSGALVINDAYNSSPASATAAINAIISIDSKRKKYIVLGDMLELGKISKISHIKLGKMAGDAAPDGLFLVGDFKKLIARGSRESGFPKEKIYICKDIKEAGKILHNKAKKNDMILLKASRKVGLEKIIEYLH